MKARAQSAGVSEAEILSKGPKDASQTRPRPLSSPPCPTAPSGSSARPGRREARPGKTQSKGNLAPLVLKKFQVNSEPERETAAVHREVTWPNYLRRGEGRWANVWAPKGASFTEGRGSQEFGCCCCCCCNFFFALKRIPPGGFRRALT